MYCLIPLIKTSWGEASMVRWRCTGDGKLQQLRRCWDKLNDVAIKFSPTRPRLGLLWGKLSLPLPKSFSMGVAYKSPLMATVFYGCSYWHSKLLQGFHGKYCLQLETSGGGAIDSCTLSATGSLCKVYEWFHWKRSTLARTRGFWRIIISNGRYDQKHTDPIVDWPIITCRQCQKPACSTHLCRAQVD